MNICLVNAHRSLKAPLHKRKLKKILNHTRCRKHWRRINGLYSTSLFGGLLKAWESTLWKLGSLAFPSGMCLHASELSSPWWYKHFGSRISRVWEETRNSLINHFSLRIFSTITSRLKMTPRENLEPSGLALGSSKPIWDGNKMLNNLKSIAQVSGQITNRHVPLPVCTTSLTKKFSQTDIRLFFLFY